jgi:serine/threonine protein kinase/formylglycine-generating enzyme required for sulfatase activity
MGEADELEEMIWPEDLPSEVLEELRIELDLAAGSEGELLDSIQSRAQYDLGSEIGHGGMGLVRAAWDGNLRRKVAMKVVRRLEGAQAGRETPSSERVRLLHRFLREARIAGQLAHPGIVPVHELGRLPNGTMYFTMPVVHGSDLDEVFAWSLRGQRDWSIPRALGILLRVCETLAYAHQRGVIHRDLKPDNVMVGAFGETYVLDWGLAKVLGSPTWLDDAPSKADERDEPAIDPGEDVALTHEGAAMGSASFMAPEQAAGKVAAVGPMVDVYAAGALLYTLLAGRRPYQNSQQSRTREQVIAAVLAGPPPKLAELAPGQPAELVAIVQKAMAREPAQRYSSMEDMAQDLRAFLENRVVRAHRTGALIELWKWVQRNRAVAAATAVTTLAVVGALAWNAEVQAASRRAVLLSADVSLLPYLHSQAETLWPAHPDMLPAMDAWLIQAAELSERSPLHEAQLAAIESRAEESGQDGMQRFAHPDDRIAYEKQTGLVNGLRRLADENKGRMREVRERRSFAASVEEQTISGAPARRLWEEAGRSIADPDQCPLYRGLLLGPQLGLVPLGRDPSSGLWEFAHLQTGEIPERAPDGELLLTQDTGLVFVLLPGGEFLMGAQAQEETKANYMPFANPSDGPVQAIVLRPFFLSKYEMTQAQWVRVRGANPAIYEPAATEKDASVGLLHPVENVTWYAASETVRRLALSLPTEAQWEYAARAGTSTCWWTGSEAGSLEGAENLVDRTAREAGIDWLPAEAWADGYFVHAPVHALRPNPFGLYAMLGNVSEWCLDRWGSLELPTREGDGLRLTDGVLACALRGGNFATSASGATAVARSSYTPEVSDYNCGLRPARAVQ